MTIRNQDHPDEYQTEPHQESDVALICCRSACDVCVLDLPTSPEQRLGREQANCLENEINPEADEQLLALLEAFERAESMVEQMTLRSRQLNTPSDPKQNGPSKEATNGG